MTGELAERVDRPLTLLLGALYVTGPTWCLLALGLGGWPELASVPLYLGVAVVAYVAGAAVLLWGWRRGPLDRRVAAGLIAVGSVVIAAGATAAGPIGATAFGGLYTYVTAVSFLWFPLRWAAAQLGFAGATYAVALQASAAPGPLATWALVMGTATAGAGVVGLLGARFRRLYLAEARLAVKLAEADELKSTFLQAVSHELRTPLSAVQGYTETLDEHLHRLDAAEVAEMVGRLRGASQRLDGLLGDLLDVERLRRGAVPPRRAPCDVARLLADVIAETPADEHDIVLETGELTARVEAAKLERIAVNLVANAVKHTPPGTRVVVRARPWGEHGMELDVADDGPGLDGELAARLFEPFEQGRAASSAPSPGMGLGLAVSSRFAELHGGEIWTEPGLGGRGVTFRVRLPGGAADTALAATPAGAAHAAHGAARGRHGG